MFCVGHGSASGREWIFQLPGGVRDAGAPVEESRGLSCSVDGLTLWRQLLFEGPKHPVLETQIPVACSPQSFLPRVQPRVPSFAVVLLKTQILWCGRQDTRLANVRTDVWSLSHFCGKKCLKLKSLHPGGLTFLFFSLFLFPD